MLWNAILRVIFLHCATAASFYLFLKNVYKTYTFFVICSDRLVLCDSCSISRCVIFNFFNAEISFCCRCSIRFPSTSIRLFFQSLIEEPESMESDEMPSPPKMKPLNINIPPSHMSAEGVQDDRGHLRMRASPPCSPAGTISVPNSCPTSPNRYCSTLDSLNDNFSSWYFILVEASIITITACIEAPLQPHIGPRLPLPPSSSLTLWLAD